MHFTTHCKNALNKLLGVVGLQISTTRLENIEAARLRRLCDRDHWSSARYSAGIQFDAEGCRRFLESVVLPYRHDFIKLPEHSETHNEFFLNNGWFGPVDAEVLYAMIRHHKPRNVVEVGSGFSSRLIRKAIRDSHSATYLTCVDPEPRVDMIEAADELIKVPVQEIPSSLLLERLCPGDVLFIDSSHSLKTGGDVPFLFLELAPKLPPGVLVHVHDMFLPFDYPMEWVVDQRWGWTEQYLVHAFLYRNSACQVTWPARYAWTQCFNEVSRVIPSSSNVMANPSSLWFTTFG